jgi:hypothetical protein
MRASKVRKLWLPAATSTPQTLPNYKTFPRRTLSTPRHLQITQIKHLAINPQ